MAQNKTSSTDTHASVADLSDQIATLKSDIAAISDILTDIGADKRDRAAAQVRETAADVRDRGQEQLKSAQARVEDAGTQAADAVRQQPATAIGVAVGIGFLIGLVTSRK